MSGTPGFIPERLREAREANRIPSQAALARLLQIVPSTVSRWEDGSSSPDPEMLIRLATELRVRPAFFLRPTFETSRPVFFRSQSSALVRDLNYQRSHMRWLQEIAGIVQHYVDLPSVDIPDVLKGASYRQLRDEDIEAIAADLREHWGLGVGPCGDMINLLERVGCVVASIEMGTSKLDGLCSWSADGRPHVLLALDKMSFARRQMDAGHELAHAVLHRSVSPEEFRRDLRQIEQQAFRLASALLLPATSFVVEARVASLSSFVTLKERWRVSIKAQIKRLADLEAIPPEYAQHLYKMYSAKGWSRQEPFDSEWPLQQPRVLRDALNLIVDGKVRTKADLLSNEFTHSAATVESLCNLPPGWFKFEGEVVRLKAHPPSKMADGVSRVIEFPRKPTDS